MEALTIRERILGRHNPEVPNPVIFRGAVFADNARFDRCLELWLHALYLRQMTGVSVVKDLLRFAQVFSQMVHVGVKVTYDHVVEVLAAAIDELERNKFKIAHPGPKDDPEVITVSFEGFARDGRLRMTDDVIYGKKLVLLHKNNKTRIKRTQTRVYQKLVTK